MDPPEKRRRGPYKLPYLDQSNPTKTVPNTTKASRIKKAAEAERNAENNGAGQIIGELAVHDYPLNPLQEVEQHESQDEDDPDEASFSATSPALEREVMQESSSDISEAESDNLLRNPAGEQDSPVLSQSEESDDDSQSSSSQSFQEFEDAYEVQEIIQEGDAGDAAKHNKVDYVQKYHLNDKLHPNFPHSRLEVLLMIFHLAIRHGYTQHFIEDQIKFINTLFGSNILDISYHVFKNVFPPSSMERHYFCDSCQIYIGSQKDFPKDLKFQNCPKADCAKTIDIHSVDSSNYFITLSIKDQIEALLKRPGMKLIPRAERGTESISDVFDGELYKRLLQRFNDGDFFTCVLNTDGVRVFENSEKNSMWPVFLYLNEIVPELRFKSENLILAALYFGKGSPNMALYLKPVLEQLLKLSQNGVSVTQPDGSINQSPVFAIGLSVDSVAKAKVLCQRQYNGGYSCLYCTHPNDAVAEEGSHLKHFETSVSYPTRTEEQVMSDMLQADTLERAGQLKKSSVCGFLGLSILLMLSRLVDTIGWNPFHIVWSVVIDYMHALLEGVSSDLLELYVSNLSEEQIVTVNKRIDQITLPHGMSRKPRHLGGKIKYKAKEYRSFFLYFAIACFEDLLPARMLSNLKLYVSSLHILLGDSISAEDLQRARSDLQKFVTGFQSIFGLPKVTYNLHLCTHLADQVLQNGPLWAYSNFIFESGNGLLVKLVRGTRSVINEISIKFLRLQAARLCIDCNPISNLALEFCNDILGCKYTKGENFQGCPKLF